MELTAKDLAMMAYNPSIGRVLEKGGVGKFEEMAWEEVQKLRQLESAEDFDGFHNNFVGRVLETIKTNREEKPSYGQAQKPVNVFLKVYVAYANLPGGQTAGKLKPFLHVPLDKVVMKYFRKKFPSAYRRFILPIIDQYQEFAREKGFSGKLGDRLYLEIAKVHTRDHYYAWQNLFRSLYPGNPVLLDFVWSFERRNTLPEIKD